MANKIAAPKNTGGGGYVFETKVVAGIFASMLARRPFLDQHLGTPVKVEFQTRPAGWFLDDVLITSKTATSTHQLALSVKSNVQFTAASAPSDFVEAAWEQWHHIGTNVFERSADCLVLVTATLSEAARQSVKGLFQKLLTADARTFVTYIDQQNWANENERALFASFHRTPFSRDETVRLLKRSRFIQHDFDNVVSTSLEHGLQLCELCMRDGTKNNGEALWDRLCRIADNYRPNAGAITRDELVDMLRQDFELIDSPDYQADWLKLDGISKQNVSSVVNNIAGRVELVRTIAVEYIEKELSKTEILAFLGASGIGKSVVARKIYERRSESNLQTLWIDARSLECNDLSVYEATLNLNYPLRILLPNALSTDPVVIIDGLDRIYNDKTFDNLVGLMRICRQSNHGNRWKILIPCQSTEWMRVSEKLAPLTRAVPIQTVQLERLAAEELEPVIKAIPALANLFAQPRIASLLLNLKILDLVARKASEGASITGTQWVSEVSVADWFWNAEVNCGRNSLVRGRFARDLATRQADKLVAAIAIDDFTSSDLDGVESLRQDQICQTVANDRLAFSHDLYGDWVRLRLLRNSSQDLNGFLASRGDSPLWQRALRLFGIGLIEDIDGLAKWEKTLTSLSESNHAGVKDAFLEGLMYSSNLQHHLDALLPVLQQNNARLLNRLITRFIAFATGPGELAKMVQSKTDKEIFDLSLFDRVPNHPAWPEFIKFLHKHQRQLLQSQAPKISELVLMWLEAMPDEVDARSEAAELGVKLGKRAIEHFAAEECSWESEDQRRLYRCLLLAASEFPDDVSTLALEAAGRSKEPLDDGEQYTWPEGPFKEIDIEFRTAVLEKRNIQKLFIARPAIAREVILATLVEYPTSASMSHRRHSPILKRMNWLPITFIHGPFLWCLRQNFDEGLELVTRLVNLATQHALSFELPDDNEEVAGDGRVERYQPITLVTEEGLHQIYGNEESYLWSIGAGNSSMVVTIALMALEKYLYVHLEAQQEISSKLQEILRKSSTVPIVSILTDIGKLQPKLFEGVLKPLLFSPTIFTWDIKKGVKGRDHLMIVNPLRPPPAFLMHLAHEFNSLKHRKVDLRTFFGKLIATQSVPIDYLDKVRTLWGHENYQDPLIAETRLHLIGYLDPDWITKGIEGATRDAMSDFNLSQETPSKYDDVMERAQLIQIAFQCRKVIDSAAVLHEEELDEWWQRCCILSEMSRPEITDNPDNTYEIGDEWDNAITGCITLLLRHSEWCTKYPDREQSLVDSLVERWSEQPQRRIDVNDNLLRTSWECFLAESIALLWTKNLNSPNFRLIVSQMVMMTYKPLMLETLFGSCAPYRSKIGEDFYRLKRLAMDAAFLKVRCDLLSRFADHFEVDHTKRHELWQNIETWLTGKIDAFISGSSPSQLLEWIEYDRMDDFPSIEAKRREWGHPELDLNVIRSANIWLPLPNQAETASERESILQFWRNAANFVARRVKSSYENYPMEDDTWVLENLGAALAHAYAHDMPHLLWEPILDLPAEYHEFQKTLMAALHQEALTSDEIPTHYIATVREIFQKMLDAVDDKQRWRTHETVWDALVGIDISSRRLWKDAHEPVVRSLLDIYGLWMRSVPLTEERLASFAIWLKEPAADPLRLDALMWFAELVRRDERGLIFSSNAQDSTAALLNEIWIRQEQNVRAKEEIFAAFRRVLDWLVGQQNRYALSLSGRLGVM